MRSFLYKLFSSRVILSKAKDLITSTLRNQILHYVQNDTNLGKDNLNFSLYTNKLPTKAFIMKTFH